MLRGYLAGITMRLLSTRLELDAELRPRGTKIKRADRSNGRGIERADMRRTGRTPRAASRARSPAGGMLSLLFPAPESTPAVAEPTRRPADFLAGAWLKT